MCSKTFLRALLLFLAVTAETHESNAQEMPYKDFWLETYSDIGRELINNIILPDLRNALSDGERKTLEDLHVFIPHSFNPYETYATRSKGEPQVYVSGFMIQLVFMYYEALGLTTFIYHNDEDFFRYIDYMMRETVENIKRIENGRAPDNVVRYWDFLDVSMADRNALQADKRFEEFTEFSLSASMHALSFIVSHELGHIVLGHTDGKRSETVLEHRSRERDADIFAIRTLQNTDFIPLGAGPLFIVFGMFDQDPAGFDESDLYDRPWCRAYLAGKATADVLLNNYKEDDPEMRARLSELVREPLKNLPSAAGSGRLGCPHEEPFSCRNSPPFPACAMR